MSSFSFHNSVASVWVNIHHLLEQNKIKTEFIGDENTPLLHTYENNDDGVEEVQEETSFNSVSKDHDAIIREEAAWVELRRCEKNLEKLNKEINALESGFNVKIPFEERGRFRISGNQLQVKRSPGEYVSLTKLNGEFYVASTMRTRLGASLARSLLGVETPMSVKTGYRTLLHKIPTDIEMDDLTPQKLEEVIDELTIGTTTNLDML